MLALPPEIYAVFFLEGVNKLMQLQFLAPVEFFKAVERLQFLTRVEFFLKIYSFFARGVSCLHFLLRREHSTIVEGQMLGTVHIMGRYGHIVRK